MPRAALTFLAMMSSSTIAFGSLWEDQSWALLGTMSTATGYDSNLTLLHDGPGGFFLTANPYLTLKRQNSDTNISVVGGATREEFFSGGQPSETDLAVSADVAFPTGDNVIPVYKLDASWQRSSQPNDFLGERVQNDILKFTGEGILTLTGKLGLRGDVEFDSVKFDSVALNDSLHGAAVVGVTYTPHFGTEYSLNFGSALAHSIPNDPAFTGNDVRSNEFDFTARARGEISDKVSGDFYAGFGAVNYSGGFTNHNDIPVAGADLTWGFDPRRTLVLAAYSGALYAPDGTAVETAHAFISYTDVIIAGWQLTVRAGPTRSVFSRQVFERTDNGWDYGAELAYAPSAHFRATLDVGYATRNDDVLLYEYTHYVVSIGASYSF